MQVKFIAVDVLLPYAKNSKDHSPEQVELIASSIQRFGWTNPCLVADLEILAGHGRVMAAKHLGIKRVPCIDIGHLSETDRRAYIIMDNRSAEKGASWNLEFLKEELDDLLAEGYDINLTGFSDEDYSDLFGEPEALGADSDPDATPEPPEDPITRLGDTWVLGPHRVRCGDSTSTDDWDMLMQGERADACWTDPPYNVDLGRKNRLMDGAIGGERAKTGGIANDKMSEQAFTDLIAGAYACLFTVLKPGGACYVAHSDKAGGVFRAEYERAGFHFSQMLIWNKNMHVLGMADFQPKHEPIIYGWKSGSKHRWYGGRKQTTVIEAGEGGFITRGEDGRWQIRVGDSVLIVDGSATLSEAPSSVFNEPKPERSGLRASQKPVNLIERMLKNSARSGDLVVDAFGGSGSTLIAADRLGMSARLMELNPKFVDVIVQRWQDYTGRRAVHAFTGVPFGDDQPTTSDGEDVF